MDVELFFRKKEVWLSFLSLLGQFIILSVASVMLVYKDISLVTAGILVLVIIGFTFIFAITILRLVHLARIMDNAGSRE